VEDGKRTRRDADGTSAARASTRDASTTHLSSGYSHASSEEIELVDENAHGRLTPRISEGNDENFEDLPLDADLNDLISEADALLDEVLCSEGLADRELDEISTSPQELNSAANSAAKRPAPAEGLCRDSACRSPSIQEVIEDAESEYNMLCELSARRARHKQVASGGVAALGWAARHRGEASHGHDGPRASGIAVAGGGPAELGAAASAPRHAGRTDLGSGPMASCCDARSERSDAHSASAQPGEQDACTDLSSDDESLDMMVSISQQCDRRWR